MSTADVMLFRGEAAAELLPVEMIAPWEHNPRRTIDPAAIEELAASIGKVGVLQPILVRAELPQRIAAPRWRSPPQSGMG